MIKVSTTGMAVSLKTDLRFPESGQHGHGSRIIHSPLSSSITNSDLNLAEKFLLVRDIIIILLSVVFTVYQIH